MIVLQGFVLAIVAIAGADVFLYLQKSDKGRRRRRKRGKRGRRGKIAFESQLMRGLINIGHTTARESESAPPAFAIFPR